MFFKIGALHFFFEFHRKTTIMEFNKVAGHLRWLLLKKFLKLKRRVSFSCYCSSAAI